MKIADIGWLLELLGVNTEGIPDDALVRLTWMNLPTSGWWFLLIGIIVAGAYGIFWLYRREINTCPPWAKVVLGCLRTAVLLVLVAIVLQPALIYSEKVQLMPLVVMVRDTSQSMQNKDAYLDDAVAARAGKVLGVSVEEVRSQQPNRVDLLEKVLEQDDRKLLRELEYHGKLRAIDFSNRVDVMEVRLPRSKEADAAALEEKKEIPPVAPLAASKYNGQGTDLYKALAEALSEKHTAAVVLFSDGQHTGREMGRDDILELVSQKGVPQADRVPIFAVGVGDPNKPRNLSLAEIYADPQVFPEEPFEIKAVVRGQDIGDRPVRIDLIEQAIGENGQPTSEPKVVDTRAGEVIPESGKLDLTFKVTAGQPGQYGYTVRVEKIENESNDDDNEPKSPTVVKVLENKAKVLLIAGAPTWEYRMVQRLLTREKSVELYCWLQTLDENRAQEGNAEPLTKLPTDKKELFAYDVIMMFDPDPIEFNEEWIELLRQFVGDHAGGLLYMAGAKFSGRFLGAPRTAKVKDILPVKLGDVGAMEVQNLLASNTRAWPLAIEPANADMPIMRFDPDPIVTQNLWKNMPGIYWSFPSEGPKPAARVLIEHSDPTLRRLSGSRPLLVTGQYGSGRTIYLGFNGTWRWRKVGHNAEYFKRFWVQSTRYLIEGRSLEGRRRGYVEADKARYQLGDPATLVARDLKDENFNLYELPEMQAVIEPEGEEPRTVTLQKVPNQQGVYQTTFTPQTIGRHVVKLSIPASAGTPPKIETSFSVSLPTVETNEVALNKSLLYDLAKASGGDYFEIDEVEKIPALIPERIRENDIQKPPRMLWDTNRVLILLVLLLSIEWGMRKAFKLL